MTIEDFNNIEYTITKSIWGTIKDFYDVSDFITQMEEEYECSFEEIGEIDIYEHFENYLKKEYSDILNDEELEISLI